MERDYHVVRYEGSEVQLKFPMAMLRVKDCFSMREDQYAFNLPPNDDCMDCWVTSEECVIDSARSKALLKRIRSRIPLKEALAVKVLFNETLKTDKPLLKEILQRFGALENKNRRSNSYKRAKLWSHMWEKCCDSQVRKKIRKYLDCKLILKMRLETKNTLKTIANRLKLSISTVVELWHKLRTSNGDTLVRLHEQINTRIAINHFLYLYFEQISNENGTLAKTVQQLYDDARMLCSDTHSFSKTYFFSMFKHFGFRYRNIRFEPRAAKRIDGWHLRSFLSVYLHFIFVERHFRILFFDESAICPSNYKRRAWRAKGQGCEVESKIKYEKIMLIGAMSQHELVGLQILHSSFNKDVFTNFVLRVVQSQLSNLGSRQQLVLFLDNCSVHRQTKLMDFCREHGVVLFFNLPRSSQFNPIEYLWEFIKRPLRDMTTYTG